jgi:acyl-CoA thioesterase-1
MIGEGMEMTQWRRVATRRAALARVLSGGVALHCSSLALPLRAAEVSGSGALAPAKLLVVGDSLSAEYGLARGTGWVALLGQRMALEKKNWQVVNASISGDTTSGGRSRLPALLAAHRPKLVLIELGGNDALRGLPLSATQDNLLTMVKLAQAAGAKVLLLGMQVPPNYGAQYTKDFASGFAKVSAETHAKLVPFLLRGVADRADAEDWFQADRIHPKAQAHPIILENVWPVLQPLLS